MSRARDNEYKDEIEIKRDIVARRILAVADIFVATISGVEKPIKNVGSRIKGEILPKIKEPQALLCSELQRLGVSLPDSEREAGEFLKLCFAAQNLKCIVTEGRDLRKLVLDAKDFPGANPFNQELLQRHFIAMLVVFNQYQLKPPAVMITDGNGNESNILAALKEVADVVNPRVVLCSGGNSMSIVRQVVEATYEESQRRHGFIFSGNNLEGIKPCFREAGIKDKGGFSDYSEALTDGPSSDKLLVLSEVCRQKFEVRAAADRQYVLSQLGASPVVDVVAQTRDSAASASVASAAGGQDSRNTGQINAQSAQSLVPPRTNTLYSDV